MSFWWNSRWLARHRLRAAAFLNRTFIGYVGLEILPKALLSSQPLGSPPINQVKLPANSGAQVSNTSNVSKGRSSMEAGTFNQIVLFSAGGLAMSMAFVFVGGVRILYPWF
jgi:hypothetical protein